MGGGNGVKLNEDRPGTVIRFNKRVRAAMSQYFNHHDEGNYNVMAKLIVVLEREASLLRLMMWANKNEDVGQQIALAAGSDIELRRILEDMEKDGTLFEQRKRYRAFIRKWDKQQLKRQPDEH